MRRALQAYTYAGFNELPVPDPVAARRARALAVAAVILGLVAIPFGVHHWLDGRIWLAGVYAGTGLVLFGLPVLLRATHALELAAHLFAALVLGVLILTTWMRGGLGSEPSYCFCLVPAVATVVGGRRPGCVWLGIAVAALLVFLALELAGVRLVDQMPLARRAFVHFVLPFGLLLPIASVCLAQARIEDHVLERALRAERDRVLASKAESMARTERLALVGQMSAGIAHEINNPLTYVLGNLEYLESEVRAPPTEGRVAAIEEALRDTREGAQRIRSIVRRLGAHVRNDQETARPLRVSELLQGALLLVKHELRHRARVYKHLHSDPLILVDEGQMVQVLLNLLFNAAQALAEPHDDNRIDIVVLSRGDQVEILVRDNGPGIPRAILPRVTEPFFTTKPVGQGTGLGLSICSSILRRYGGTLSIDSTAGSGTQVRLVLPRADETQAAGPPTATAAAAPQPVADLDPDLRVLLVDDDELVAQALSRMLAGQTMVHEPSGAAALRRLATGAETFDAVVCDVRMPGMSGLEFYDALSAAHPDLAARFLMITGGGAEEQLDRFVREREIPLMRKPIDRDRLHEVLARLVRKARR